MKTDSPTFSNPGTIISRNPLPNSNKIYHPGQRFKDIKVPFREIKLTATNTSARAGSIPNTFLVYDTSGPYTDPSVSVDVRKGLPRTRESWVERRGDTEAYVGMPVHREVVSEIHNTPRRARTGKNVSQMHYARAGIVTPEMEYVAIRENAVRNRLRNLPGWEERNQRQIS